jgi:hypothetical protein
MLGSHNVEGKSRLPSILEKYRTWFFFTLLFIWYFLIIPKHFLNNTIVIWL